MDELESEGVAARRNAVGSSVIGTIKRAVCCTASVVSAYGLVPAVAGVAVGVVARLMDPTPVGVEDNTTSDVLAAASGSASLPIK